jgi:hypothetical protein
MKGGGFGGRMDTGGKGGKLTAKVFFTVFTVFYFPNVTSRVLLRNTTSGLAQLTRDVRERFYLSGVTPCKKPHARLIGCTGTGTTTAARAQTVERDGGTRLKVNSLIKSRSI